MKIYGITLISSDGNLVVTKEDGLKDYVESFTKVFTDKQDCIDFAVSKMKELFNNFDFENGEDENFRSEQDFELDLKNFENIVIQACSEHISIELFEQELKVSTISVETPKGALVAEVKGAKDEYPGIWIYNETFEKILSAVEYDSCDEHFKTEVYANNNDEPCAIINNSTGHNLL